MQRLDGVDTLRGLSILAVILLHIFIRFTFFGVYLGRDWPEYTQHLVFFNGVTVFFAVSGFLITLTSLRRFGSLGAMRASTFYRIRFARIMPLLLLLLAVLTVLHLKRVEGFQINTDAFTLKRALFAALTFHLNWLEGARNAYLPPCWTVLWSLSIEEMFYLFFPLACILLLRRDRRWGMAAWTTLALALIAMGPFARTVWSQTGLQRNNSYLAGMATIALGCLTAVLAETLLRRDLRPEWMLLLAQGFGWAILLLMTIRPGWPLVKQLGKSGLDDTALALGVCLVMLATTLRRRHGRPWTAPLRWFGRHSYELYLSHEFVILFGVDFCYARCCPHAASRGVLALFVTGMILATAPLAWALADWFTEPANRWLRGARMAR
jgi:peptidoglycan/LPS O-acetylase OafA/YrhL